MISAGKHMAKVAAWGLIGSESTNNPVQFVIEFEVVEGDHAGEEITWFGFFSDNAFPYTMEKIRRAGLVGDDLRTLSRSTDEPVQISIKHENYNNEMRAKVVGIGGGSILAAKALDAGQAGAFAERMKQRIKAFDAKAGSPSPSMAGTRRTAPTAAGRGREPGDDDIPPFDDIPFGR